MDKFYNWLLDKKFFKNRRDWLFQKLLDSDRQRELYNCEEVLKQIVGRSYKKHEDGKDFNCYCISCRPGLYKDVKAELVGIDLKYFDGTGYPSFSKLVNECVAQCPTDRIIMVSDKAFPQKRDIDKLNYLLDIGYAWVGPYQWGFFGFDRSLFDLVGPMDERFLAGWHSDTDFMLRLQERDLAYYYTKEIKYISIKSSWDHEPGRQWFLKKWKNKNGEYARVLPDEVYTYDFPIKEINYLDFRFTVHK